MRFLWTGVLALLLVLSWSVGTTTPVAVADDATEVMSYRFVFAQPPLDSDLVAFVNEADEAKPMVIRFARDEWSGEAVMTSQDKESRLSVLSDTLESSPVWAYPDFVDT